MIKFIMGVAIFIFGLMMMPIPIIGWFFGILAMLTGFVLILSGIFGGSSSDSEKEIVYHDFEHPLNETRQKQREQMFNKSKNNNSKVNTSDELEKLSKLFEKGHLTEEEFRKAKSELLR